MDTESVKILRRVIIDFICLCCVGFPILYFYLFGVPYKRGFFCDDESIRHPFHSSTIPNKYLYVVGLALPIIVILAIEYIHHRSNRHFTRRFMDYPINSWVWRSYCAIGVFGFGAASSQFLTDVAKYSIGRLRPHFYEVCMPDVNCDLPDFKYKYIENFECLNTDKKLIREARLSFLSGHSSFSAYTMIYLILYLNARMTWKGSHLLKHLLQFFCFLLAWGTALSRISDYKHHWSDVLAGSILGTTVAIVVIPSAFLDFPPTVKCNTENYPMLNKMHSNTIGTNLDYQSEDD